MNTFDRLLGVCILFSWVSFVAGQDFSIVAPPTAAVDRVIVRYTNLNATRGRRGLQGLEIVPLNEEDTVDQAMLRLESLPEVLQVEPDYMVEALVTPNDNRWHLQWGLRAISAEKAWEVSTGSRDVTVCVIDSGVDFLHPELQNNMHPNLGYDTFTQKPLGESNDLNGHGTHVAGVVAAIGNNTAGISGLNWKASILGCKVLDADGVGYMSGILACIDYCVKANATISVNSYTLQGLNRRSSILKDAIEQAGTRDHLYVAAAGNAGQNNDLDVDPSFPAAFNLSNILSVAALEAGSDASSPLKLAPYSNYGVYTTHIAAPGTNILSTWPNMALAYLTGTSMACPHVAGAAALIRAATNGKLSNKQIRSILLETTRNNTELDGAVSTGMLDLSAAMQSAISLANAPPILPDPAPIPSLPLDHPPSGTPLSKAKPLNEQGTLTIVLDIPGTSCQAFARGAQATYASAFRTIASADKAVKIKNVQNKCRTPALSQTDPLLQFTHTINVRSGLPSAMNRTQAALIDGGITKLVEKKHKNTSFEFRSFTIAAT